MFFSSSNKKSTTLLPSMVGLRLLFASDSETLLCYGLPAPARTLSFILSILKIQAKVNKQLVVIIGNRERIFDAYGW
jgi:hypothetical protein